MFLRIYIIVATSLKNTLTIAIIVNVTFNYHLHAFMLALSIQALLFHHLFFLAGRGALTILAILSKTTFFVTMPIMIDSTERLDHDS